MKFLLQATRQAQLNQFVAQAGTIPQAPHHVAQAGMTVLQAQVAQAGVRQVAIQAQAGVQVIQAIQVQAVLTGNQHDCH